VNKDEIMIQRDEALSLIDNLKLLSEIEKNKYEFKVKSFFK
jgi:hypothetical protein